MRLQNNQHVVFLPNVSSRGRIGSDDLLITPSSSLPIHRAESGDDNAHCDFGFLLLLRPLWLRPCGCAHASGGLLVCGTRDNAHDLSIAHFEVAGAICGGLGADLCMASSELVPASAVHAEEGEGVGGSVERHDFARVLGWQRGRDWL